MNLDIDDFAVKGERGVDLFSRRQDQASRRARFVCIATVIDAPGKGQTPPLRALPAPKALEGVAKGRLLVCHEPAARRNTKALWRAVARFEEQPALHRPFSLGDAPDYPGTDGLSAPHTLFLYVEFFRERQLAAHSLERLAAAGESDAEALARLDPGELAATLRLALDYNMIARTSTLWPLLQRLLAARAQLGALPPELANSTGYALRILGDLRLRAGRPDEALGAFETALKLGDNPFRRRRAIEAAAAAGRKDAASQHIAAYGVHGALPPDLRALAEASALPRKATPAPKTP